MEYEAMLLIGIDPGVNTGFAVWDPNLKRLSMVDSIMIHHAMGRIEDMGSQPLLVLMEDARLRTWFGKSGPEVWQGAGSIKRDCGIWEDFLISYKIPFLLRKPKPQGSKWTAPYFKRAIGWEGRTNEHGRDAAVLVYGINQVSAASLLDLAKSQMEVANGPRKQVVG